jgi:hypothetical protein
MEMVFDKDDACPMYLVCSTVVLTLTEMVLLIKMMLVHVFGLAAKRLS